MQKKSGKYALRASKRFFDNKVKATVEYAIAS
jgi:hypothetical protein